MYDDIWFRPDLSSAWKSISRHTAMAQDSTLNVLPELMHKYGIGHYQIVRVYIDSTFLVWFEAKIFEQEIM